MADEQTSKSAEDTTEHDVEGHRIPDHLPSSSDDRPDEDDVKGHRIPGLVSGALNPDETTQS